MHRVFVGLSLPGDTREVLTGCRESMCVADPGLRAERWVAPRNLHVRLAFLGATSDEELSLTATCVEEIAARCKRPTLTFSDAIAVPRPARASMIWVNAEDRTGALAALVAELDRTLASLGFQARQRPFYGHVTLVRFRTPQALQPDVLTAASRTLTTASAHDTTDVSVPQVTVFTSELKPDGPMYAAYRSTTLAGD